MRAIGMKHVYVINPNNLQEVDDTLDKCLALDQPSVIITRWPCALKKFSKEDKAEFDSLFVTKNKVDEEKCVGCHLPKGRLPAMSYDRKSKKVISIKHSV